MSWLPVPRRPDTFHVSITSTSAAGNSASRMSGRPSASILRVPSSITMQPPISQSQWSMPLANAQRPVTTIRRRTRGAPCRAGANTPPDTDAPAPNTSRAARLVDVGGDHAAGRAGRDAPARRGVAARQLLDRRDEGRRVALGASEGRRHQHPEESAGDQGFDHVARKPAAALSLLGVRGQQGRERAGGLQLCEPHRLG